MFSTVKAEIGKRCAPLYSASIMLLPNPEKGQRVGSPGSVPKSRPKIAGKVALNARIWAEIGATVADFREDAGVEDPKPILKQIWPVPGQFLRPHRSPSQHLDLCGSCFARICRWRPSCRPRAA